MGETLKFRSKILREGTIVLALLQLGLIHLARPAKANEPAWPKTPYQYVVVDEDLRDVLLQFGTNTGLRIVLSDKVQGHVHGRLQSAPPREFLNNLAKSFGLDWYFDGTTLWVSAGSEAATKLLALRGVRLSNLERSLRATDLYDHRFALRSGWEPNLAIASGPPHYLYMVEQVLNELVAGLNHPIAVVTKSEPKRVVTIIRGTDMHFVEFPLTGKPSTSVAVTVKAKTIGNEQRSLQNARSRSGDTGKRT